MQIYIRSKSAQSHLKKSAFKDADKIRSDSTNKNQHDLGKLMFFSLTILPLPPPKVGEEEETHFQKHSNIFSIPGSIQDCLHKKSRKKVYVIYSQGF